MGALDAHTAMSTQALNLVLIQDGMRDILLNYDRLWETLREKKTGECWRDGPREPPLAYSPFSTAHALPKIHPFQSIPWTSNQFITVL